jgi:magnesium-transporting ATPase (P-type)
MGGYKNIQITPRQWQGKSLGDVLRLLQTTPQGLTSKEALHRLVRYSKNQIVFHRSRSPWLLFLSEFKALFTLLLLI